MLCSPRPRWLPVFETVAVALFFVLSASMAVRIWTVTANGSLWVAFLGIPFGILLADFLSGLVHWFCDTFFEEDSLPGRIFIGPFREHHRDPLALTRHSFLERNGNNCLVAVPVLTLAWWGRWPEDDSVAAVFGSSVLLFLGLAVFATNEIHRWAHAPATPGSIRWLQQGGWILTPERHARHHVDGAGAYCITLGWLNTPLDRVGFFNLCERLLVAAGLPRAGQRDPA
ncbi:MAG: fatty acid desaturase CarF family protein [Bryobacteraceae bacterium]